VPEWAGYDAVPQDEREFPDLSPIRGRDVRARDGRGQGERMQDAQLPDGPGYPPTGTGPRHAAPGAAAPGQGGQAGYGKAPWEDQPWPSQQPPSAQPQAYQQQAFQPQAFQPQAQQPQGQAEAAQAQSDQAQSAQAQSAQAQSAQAQSARPRSDWAGPADTGTGPMEAFTKRWERRGSDSRGDRRADRRKRRRLYAMGGGAAAVVIAVATYFLVGGNGGGSANLGLGSLVTSFLPGELQQVPNACSAVPGAMLGQYLPGQLKVAVPPLNTGANSQCTWTLDKQPMYRVLEVDMTAYSPNALVTSGNGSATFAAEYAYAEFESAKQQPGPRSGQPKATITDLPGLPGGNDTSGFEATQVFTVSGAITDVATVYVRYRNVIVTVVLNGLDHANKGTYGPVSMSDISSAAQTVAQEVTGKLVR
jgi:hypothetical protein